MSTHSSTQFSLSTVSVIKPRKWGRWELLVNTITLNRAFMYGGGQFTFGAVPPASRIHSSTHSSKGGSDIIGRKAKLSSVERLGIHGSNYKCSSLN